MTSVPTDSYCHVAREHPVRGAYHDLEYGLPLRTDDELFERLVLEINHAACPVYDRIAEPGPAWMR